MRLSPGATVGALLSLALVLSACGEGQTAAVDRPDAPAKSGSVGGSAVDRRCQSQLRPFLDAMDSLRKSLAVGLSYGEYMHELHEVRIAYDGVRADRLQAGCLLVAGTPGERALNHYIAAANAWGACLTEVSCETESIEPALQHRWALASDLLSSARSSF